MPSKPGRAKPTAVRDDRAAQSARASKTEKRSHGRPGAAPLAAVLGKAAALLQLDDAGLVVASNEAFAAHFGNGARAATGQAFTFWCAQDPANLATAQRAFARSRAGEYAECTVRCLEGAEAGGTRWARLACFPLADTGGASQALLLLTDATEACNERVDLAGQCRAIEQSQAVITFTLDGKVVSANANFLQTMGYRIEEIVGQHHSIFVEPGTADTPAYRAFWADLASGKAHAQEFKRVGKGGKEVWIQAAYAPIFDATGRPYKVMKFATDVTAAKLQSGESGGRLRPSTAPRR